MVPVWTCETLQEQSALPRGLLLPLPGPRRDEIGRSRARWYSSWSPVPDQVLRDDSDREQPEPRKRDHGSTSARPECDQPSDVTSE